MELSDEAIAQRLAERKRKKEELTRRAAERRKALEIHEEARRQRQEERQRRKHNEQVQTMEDEQRRQRQEELLQREREERERLKERLASLRDRNRTETLRTHLETTETALRTQPSEDENVQETKDELDGQLQQHRRQQAQLRALRRERLRKEYEEAARSEDAVISDLRKREEALKTTLVAWEDDAKERKAAGQPSAISVTRAESILLRWAEGMNRPKHTPLRSKVASRAERMRELMEAKRAHVKKREEMREARKQLEEVRELREELTRLKYLYTSCNITFNSQSLASAVVEEEKAAAELTAHEDALIAAVMRKKMLQLLVESAPSS